MDNTNAAQRVLDELTNLALLIELENTETDATSTDTYRQHGLLRIYARALMEQELDLFNASHTHAQFYTDRSWNAVTCSPQDYEFLDQHLPNLLAALQWSENNDMPLFTELLEAISNFLLIRGQSVFLERSLPKAVVAARTLSNTIREANLLMILGDLEKLLGSLDQADIHFDAALLLYREVQDRFGEARALVSLGDLEIFMGTIEQAHDHYNNALFHFTALRNYMGAANTLLSLGHLESHLGKLDQARNRYNAALHLNRNEHNRLGEANTLLSLGHLESRLGNLDQALAHCDAALPLFRIEGNRIGEANVYMHLGEIFISEQNWREAKAYFQKALSLFTMEREPLGTAGTLLNLGRTRFELGEHEQGIKDVQQAAELYRRIQSLDWAEIAEQYLTEIGARLQQQQP